MTGRGWIWLVVLVLSGVLATLRGGTASYLLFYAAIFTPVTAFLYLIYVYFRFRIFQSVGSLQIVKESSVPYSFALANEDFIAYQDVSVVFLDDYSTAEGLVSGRPVSLLPGEKWTKSTVLRCHYRGEYQVGIGRVVVRDFLGLFRITYRVSNPIRVRVFPRIVELGRFALSEDLDGRKERRAVRQQPETPDAQVRRYEAGDPIRQIHWKATARQGKLMTRQMQEEPKDEVTLLFATSLYPGTEQERLEAEDKLIEAALALVAYYVARGTAVRACWFAGSQGGMAPGAMRSLLAADRKGLDEFYELCCGLRFEGEERLSGQFLQVWEGLGSSGLCYLLAWEEEPGLPEVLAQSMETGFRPAVIAVGGVPGADGTLREALGEEIPLCRIPFGADVLRCMEGEESGIGRR